ncbi:hypothetical protein BDA99DRAFT_505093 [Phascolomyces articulosus]|uniref:Yeast cell wall synthesis Kre9/Knh1-like N-terminal domain-containing protein n=1 Tax=Phascolomyces articulosus TaxID=60185 RepID=A0AAD5KE77_9FUNG|nr:hypothetical protein BDA99DRAFT_505093 [Phascolomyces articulosus]
MKSIVAAIAALAVASVSAQQAIVSITAPLEGAKYTAGQDAIITWINPTVDTIPKIMLAKGEATLLQPVTEVASNVDAKKQTLTWKIPADTAPGQDYAFELGESPNIAYTGHFAIEAGSGSSNSSSSASAAPSSGSSASASASKPSGSASASGSSPSGSSSGSSSGSASSAEESSDESAAGKVAAAPIALALAGAVAAGLF